MFRQIQKLRRAQKAFKDGRFEEALVLADDPEIRDHVKSQELRTRTLIALKERAEAREGRGEWSAAAVDWKKLAEVGGDEAHKHRGREAERRRKDGEDAKARVRDQYWKARYESERGDLDAAADLLSCIAPEARNDEMRALLAEVTNRREQARKLVDEAKAVATKDPARAEEILARAAHLHARSAALGEAKLAYLAARVDRVLAEPVADGDFVSFLVEYGLFKRRSLAEHGLGAPTALESRLHEAVLRRISEALDGGDFEAVRALAARHSENLAPDARVEAIGAAIRAADAARVEAQRGDFEAAAAHLAQARAKLAGRRAFARLEEDVARILAEIPTIFDGGRAALRSGRLDDAKRAMLEVLERVPAHREARRVLETANKKLIEQQDRLKEARLLAERGRIDRARGILLELEAENCTLADVGVLLRELTLLDRERRPSGAPATRSPATRDDGRGGSFTAGPSEPFISFDPRAAPSIEAGRIGRAWELSVEEHGEFLVFEDDEVVIGNAVKRTADIPVLAAIASRHASIRRSTSFHGGVSYRITALDGQPLTVNGAAVKDAALGGGERIRLGREFEFTFQLPSPRSRAAVLKLGSSHQVDGASILILMPGGGRNGAVVIGDRPDAHAPTPGARGEVEIYRDGEALICRGPDGVLPPGGDRTAALELGDGSEAVAEDIRIAVRNWRVR